MDVPYSASGALSREHYTLVRRIELASSPPIADQYIVAEVQAVRQRLTKSKLTSKQCKESLILLLYCAMSITSEIPANLNLDFALSHAVNLAETGSTLTERWIGYLFCIELMPQNHDLELMLVNTLRKDLESHEVPRICLALDVLIQSPSSDVIPAVQHRLFELLSYTSAHIRRRALLSFRALSRCDPDVYKRIVDKVRKRLKDVDRLVVSAALKVAVDLVEPGLLTHSALSSLLNDMVESIWRLHRLGEANVSELVPVLRSLREMRTPIQTEPSRIILDAIRVASKGGAKSHTLLLEAFRTLPLISVDQLITLGITGRSSPVHALRPLLGSHDPTEQYLFLACLEHTDPRLWAGADPAIPAVLDGREVERVMALLDSQDGAIRRKTLGVLSRVDASIVSSYWSKLLQSVPASFPGAEDARNEHAARLLEVAATSTASDGEAYVGRVKELLSAMEGDVSNQGRPVPVLERAVEGILVHIRDGSDEFKLACVRAFLTSLVDLGVPFGPSMMVVFAALSCEYEGRSSISPVDTLHALAARMTSYTAAIQDACLLSMLRIAADCDEVPEDVTSQVSELKGKSGRYVQRRCSQFLIFSRQGTMLKDIVASAKSSSLPDFLAALESHNVGSPLSRTHTPLPSSPSVPRSRRTPPLSPAFSPSRASPSASISPSAAARKLRYAAYDAPPPAASQRIRRPSSVASSTRSGLGSPRIPPLSLGERMLMYGEEALARTVTPGALALVGGDVELSHMGDQQKPMRPTLSAVHPKQSSIAREDLIAFDSPFLTEPPGTPSRSSTISDTASEVDFVSTWDSLEHFNSRGWCDASLDVAVRKLQGLQHRLVVIAADQAPFEGSLKVLVLVPPSESDVDSLDSGANRGGSAALKLRESEDESCLWQLRCDDDELRAQIKRLLSDA